MIDVADTVECDGSEAIVAKGARADGVRPVSGVGNLIRVAGQELRPGR